MGAAQVPPNSGTRAVDVGRVLAAAGRAFLDDIVPLVLATLVTVVLTVLTLGVLAGPLTAGLCAMVIARHRDGTKPAVGDVFSQLDRFWSFFGAALLLALLIGLACITVVGGVLLAAIWVYVFPIMVDRRLGVFDAMRESKDMVLASGFWEHLGLVLLLLIVNAFGHGPIGLVTAPFTIVTIVVAYRSLTGTPTEVPPVPLATQT